MNRSIAIDKLRERLMTASTNPSGSKQLFYLDDLQVGQRFVSGTHLIDEKQIVAFASAVRPTTVSSQRRSGKAHIVRRVGRQRLAHGGDHDALMVNGGLPIAGGLVGAGGECAGQNRRGQALCYGSRAKSSNSARRDPVRTAAWRPSAVKRADQLGEIVQVLVSKLVVPRRVSGPPAA